MKNNLLRFRVLGIILIYLIATISTMVDKLTFINNWNLGINQEYWGSNSAFLASASFWFNMFLYSILPVLIAIFSIKDKLVIYSSIVLPLFWAFFLYRSITAAHVESGIGLPELKYFIYVFLFAATTVILIKLILIIRSLKVEKTIDELEKFKARATRKLEKVNPELNQKLFEEVFGDHGEALKFLIAATYEDDPDEKSGLTRMALDCAAKEKDSLQKLQKRLTLYSTVADT